MSGFEVVGVVLAVIPLVVNGLEHYQDGLRTISAMWKYQDTIMNLITTFEASAMRYRFTCESLLGPLMLPVNEYMDLLDDPGGPAWEEPSLDESIRSRLGAGCPTYIRLIQRLHKQLIKFATKMALDPGNNMNPPWMKINNSVDLKAREKFFKGSNRLWHSIKLGFDNGGLERLLEGIEKDLFRLERLMEGNDKLAPLRQARQRKGNARAWQTVRESAKGLFDALALQWHCNCGHSHTTCLRLEARRVEEIDEESLRFGVLFSFQHPPQLSAHPLPWSWRDVEIESTPSTQLPSSKAPPVGPSRKSGTVSFIISQDLVVPRKPIAPATPKIENLCKVLKKIEPKVHCLGYIEDQSWRHNVFIAVQKEAVQNTREIVSLRDFLSGGNSQKTASRSNLRALSTKEKYKTSLVLASSVLQLSHTPWLVQFLDLQEIHVIQESGGSTLVQQYAPSSSRLSQKPEQRVWIQNELLFTLGVLLIELSFGAPLSEFKKAVDVDQKGEDTMFTEQSIATRLLAELPQREPSKYVEATLRCLFCRFDSSTTSLEDPSFQELFYDGVVEPLEGLYDALL